jgi:hypothetical protein
LSFSIWAVIAQIFVEPISMAKTVLLNLESFDKYLGLVHFLKFFDQAFIKDCTF